MRGSGRKATASVNRYIHFLERVYTGRASNPSIQIDMITYDLKRAKLATQYLVNATFSSHHIRKIWTAVGKPRSLPFKNDLEHLNELVLIGRQSVQALKNLLELVEFKRDDAAAYMREFMRAKRARDSKYILLLEYEKGEKFTQTEKRQILIEKYFHWNEEKRRFLERQGNLSYEEKNAALKLFWVEQERGLDEKLTRIREAVESWSQNRRKNYREESLQKESSPEAEK